MTEVVKMSDIDMTPDKLTAPSNRFLMCEDVSPAALFPDVMVNQMWKSAMRYSRNPCLRAASPPPTLGLSFEEFVTDDSESDDEPVFLPRHVMNKNLTVDEAANTIIHRIMSSCELTAEVDMETICKEGRSTVKRRRTSRSYINLIELEQEPELDLAEMARAFSCPDLLATETLAEELELDGEELEVQEKAQEPASAPTEDQSSQAQELSIDHMETRRTRKRMRPLVEEQHRSRKSRHNQAEQNRRVFVNGTMDDLKRLTPGLNSSSSKAQTLLSVVDYIRDLSHDVRSMRHKLNTRLNVLGLPPAPQVFGEPYIPQKAPPAGENKPSSSRRRETTSTTPASSAASPSTYKPTALDLLSGAPQVDCEEEDEYVDILD